jgi:hypothetical protein
MLFFHNVVERQKTIITMKVLKLLLAGFFIVGLYCQLYVGMMLIESLDPDLVMFDWSRLVEFKVLNSSVFAEDIVVSTEIDWQKTFQTRVILAYAAIASIAELIAYVAGWDFEVL